jgi:hypothetical protein
MHSGDFMARMTIALPAEIVKIVNDTAQKESVPKTEIIRRMFTVLKVAQEEKDKGNSLGIINGEKVIARIVGV